ncbi:MAG: HIT family protein [Neisseriaceae bacterium]|nr:HIT family protein [Neisseriaceae bacterium]
MSCPLCQPQNEQVLLQNDVVRIIAVHDDANAPGFCRVIWHAHQKEMTDLSPSERHLFMHWVWATEQAMRAVLNPDKINLASFGNMVPHLHWHVIARYAQDACFPDAIWATPKRGPNQHPALAEDWPNQMRLALSHSHQPLPL